MELTYFFKSVIDQDKAPIVICDLSHTVVYMNPSAYKNYKDYNPNVKVGKSIFDCHNHKSCEMIKKTVEWFAESRDNNIIHTAYSVSKNKDIYIVALRDDKGDLIGYYEKHEFRNRESKEMYNFV